MLQVTHSTPGDGVTDDAGVEMTGESEAILCVSRCRFGGGYDNTKQVDYGVARAGARLIFSLTAAHFAKESPVWPNLIPHRLAAGWISLVWSLSSATSSTFTRSLPTTHQRPATQGAGKWLRDRLYRVLGFCQHIPAAKRALTSPWPNFVRVCGYRLRERLLG